MSSSRRTTSPVSQPWLLGFLLRCTLGGSRCWLKVPTNLKGDSDCVLDCGLILAWPWHSGSKQAGTFLPSTPIFLFFK